MTAVLAAVVVVGGPLAALAVAGVVSLVRAVGQAIDDATELPAPARACPADHRRLCDRLPHGEADGCLVCPVTL